MLLEFYNLFLKIKINSFVKNIIMNFVLYLDMLLERIYYFIYYWIKGFCLVFWYCIVYLYYSYGKYFNENWILMFKYVYIFMSKEIMKDV